MVCSTGVSISSADCITINEDYGIDTVIDLLGSYCDPFIANILPALAPACRAGPKIGAGADFFDQQTTSLAGYFQSTAHLSDALRLVGGIRYSDDTKKGGIVQVNRNPAELFHTNENTGLRLEGKPRDLSRSGRIRCPT